MSNATDPRNALIERFRNDLTALDPGEVIRKHITTGMPVQITEDDYFDLRAIIAREFNLHPSAVILVGSCRMGFSIAPKKRYRLARTTADLDIALVSPERFDVYWDGVFSYSRSNKAWKESAQYRRFLYMLFNGWIDPRSLPNVKRFKQAIKWTNFFDSLMQSRRFGRRRITARLYRTWSRLEAYQESAVRKCIANLGGTIDA